MAVDLVASQNWGGYIFVCFDNSQTRTSHAILSNFTPTFIFYIGGGEVGRIVERPESSLEQAIQEVLHAG